MVPEVTTVAFAGAVFVGCASQSGTIIALCAARDATANAVLRAFTVISPTWPNGIVHLPKNRGTLSSWQVPRPETVGRWCVGGNGLFRGPEGHPKSSGRTKDTNYSHVTVGHE